MCGEKDPGVLNVIASHDPSVGFQSRDRRWVPCEEVEVNGGNLARIMGGGISFFSRAKRGANAAF